MIDEVDYEIRKPTVPKFDIGDLLIDDNFGPGLILRREWDTQMLVKPNEEDDTRPEEEQYKPLGIINEWKYYIRFPELDPNDTLNRKGIMEGSLDHLVSIGSIKIKRTRKDALDKKRTS